VRDAEPSWWPIPADAAGLRFSGPKSKLPSMLNGYQGVLVAAHNTIARRPGNFAT